jgi:hypothetical protein
VVARALVELSVVAAEVTEQLRRDDRDALMRGLRRLQRLSENMGLVSLATIAQDTVGCILAQDQVAFASVWARLQRVMERTFAPAPDMADLSV